MRCYPRNRRVPASPFASGGSAAAGERGGDPGLGRSAGVAKNVKLPRASRGHPGSPAAFEPRQFAAKHSFRRPIVERSVKAFLKCGDLQEGFARVRCPDYHRAWSFVLGPLQMTTDD